MKINANQNTLVIPAKFGNGSEIIHNIYGRGKCVGFVRGQFWRIEFESGYIGDFLPSKLFANSKLA